MNWNWFPGCCLTTLSFLGFKASMILSCLILSIKWDCSNSLRASMISSTTWFLKLVFGIDFVLSLKNSLFLNFFCLKYSSVAFGRMMVRLPSESLFLFEKDWPVWLKTCDWVNLGRFLVGLLLFKRKFEEEWDALSFLVSCWFGSVWNLVGLSILSFWMQSDSWGGAGAGVWVSWGRWRVAAEAVDLRGPFALALWELSRSFCTKSSLFFER